MFLLLRSLNMHHAKTSVICGNFETMSTLQADVVFLHLWKTQNSTAQNYFSASLKYKENHEEVIHST